MQVLHQLVAVSDLRRVVGRTIIHHYNLHIAVRLRQRAFDGFSQKAGLVVARDYDGYERSLVWVCQHHLEVGSGVKRPALYCLRARVWSSGVSGIANKVVAR